MQRFALVLCFILVAASAGAQGKRQSHRLPAVEIKQPVIWGSECVVDDNWGLAFGGEDQESPSGSPGTRIRETGKWKSISDELAKSFMWTKKAEELRTIIAELRRINALQRRTYFEGRSSLPETLTQEFTSEDYPKQTPNLAPIAQKIKTLLAVRIAAISEEAAKRKKLAESRLEEAGRILERVSDGTDGKRLASDVRATRECIEQLERAADILGAEPPPRALSPIVYDADKRVFVLFGGDHLDYLTNDTWVFDPKTLSWSLIETDSAPPPRADHKFVSLGGGKVKLEGGYTYTSNTDYMGGQYADIGDGEWEFDLATRKWSGSGGVSPFERTYRTGKFSPDYFLQGPTPSRQDQAERLANLPQNAWISLDPPHLPEMNRDWGTAILDPDRNLILRWSGGHCAHSGSDVLQYHIATNRWELPIAVEFPLGQTYTNTEYPEGVNFNRRPWVTGHTYQSYAYDTQLKKMLFVGRVRGCFVYDPDLAEWESPIDKPKGMSYGSCYYTLTCTPTPQGLSCWTNEGRMFQFDAKQGWQEKKLTGEKLPGSIVDNSTIAYDSKRDRLLAVRKEYGDKTKFSGTLWSVNCKTWEVAAVHPSNESAGEAVPYLCQLRYDAENDLLLVGGTLPPDATGLRRTPAYDCAKNEWISLRIQGDDPSGKEGRNVSLGIMYDAKRKLYWAVDTKSRVFVLKLAADTADRKPLGSSN